MPLFRYFAQKTKTPHVDLLPGSIAKLRASPITWPAYDAKGKMQQQFDQKLEDKLREFKSGPLTGFEGTERKRQTAIGIIMLAAAKADGVRQKIEAGGLKIGQEQWNSEFSATLSGCWKKIPLSLQNEITQILMPT